MASRVSTGQPSTTAWVPMKQSGSTCALLPRRAFCRSRRCASCGCCVPGAKHRAVTQADGMKSMAGPWQISH